MNEEVDVKVGEFLKDILETGNASVKKFEDKVSELNFEGINATAWQFIVIKAFEPNFSHFRPLAHHLLDHNYCLVEGPMVKYAALNGYQLEAGLASMQKPLDEVNKITQECGFTEKVIVVNKPAEEIIALAKKIVSRSNDTDYNEVKDILEKAGVNVSQSPLMYRPQVSKTLKL